MGKWSDLPWDQRPPSRRQPSMTVQEQWQWDDDPDAMDHRWSNYCLSCKAEDYEPYSPQLLHYCIKCGQHCIECGHPKPIYAFPYNQDSEAYKAWKIGIKGKGSIGRAPREAHINVCNHCTGKYLDEAEKLQKEAEVRAHKEMVDSPEAKDALRIMLGG